MKGSKRTQTTLRDIAQAVNVSEMTVSRVLRNSGPVAEKTRAKILEAADKLGFVPNNIAGSLATSTSNLVAVIIPSLSSQVFTEVLAGITESLESSGYKSVMGISEYDPEREEALIRSVLSWRPSGLVISSMRHSDSTRNILQKSGIPIVEIMGNNLDPIDTSVGVDHQKAGRLMAEHFIDKGYRKIGYVGSSNSDLTASIRYQGFIEALNENGLNLVGSVEFEKPLDMKLGKEGLNSLLAKHPKVDAVYFPNDISAIGGYFFCLENNIDVPTELAIGGFSGLQAGQLMPVPLTTVYMDRFNIGQIAAETIIKNLEDKPTDKINILDIELREGGTS